MNKIYEFTEPHCILRTMKNRDVERKQFDILISKIYLSEKEFSTGYNATYEYLNSIAEMMHTLNPMDYEPFIDYQLSLKKDQELWLNEFLGFIKVYQSQIDNRVFITTDFEEIAESRLETFRLKKVFLNKMNDEYISNKITVPLSEKDNANELDIIMDHHCENDNCTGCDICYNMSLIVTFQQLPFSKVSKFIDYQVANQEDNAVEWLDQLLEFIDIIENQEVVKLDEDKMKKYKTSISRLTDNIDKEIQQSIINATSKIKLNCSVPQLSFLFRLLEEQKVLEIPQGKKQEFFKCLSEYFSTKQTVAPSVNAIKNHFDTPDDKAIDFWRNQLQGMNTIIKKYI